jgi:adenosylcobinamide-GDP ribazoletransferase
LGAAVAGVVPVAGALGVAVGSVAVAEVCGLALGVYGVARAFVVALVVAELLLRHCRRRFGGVTGDVFGGLAETAGTVALVVLSLGG